MNQQHIVSGTISRADGIHIRAVADVPPANGAAPVAPNLEDAYLYSVSRSAQ
ncbi:MAG: hypothetical protein H8E48_14015 [Chloroflexi bacterium]|nr:hypothetical protein [Chloroflexota bacterium]